MNNTLSELLNGFRLDSFNLEVQPRAIVTRHYEMVRLTMLASYAEHDEAALQRLADEPLFGDWADLYEATASRLEMEAACRAMMAEAQAVVAAL